MAQSPSPPAGLHPSRVPGGFETDEDLSVSPTIRSASDRQTSDSSDESTDAQTKSTHVPEREDNTTLSDEGRSQIEDETSTLSEQEMRRRLMDMDSSFMAQLSPAANLAPSEDTAIYFPCEDRLSARDERFDREDLEDLGQALDGEHDTISLSESMSSPTAAAAARILSRVKSSSSDDRDTTENTRYDQENERRGTESDEHDDTTPQIPTEPSPQSGIPTPIKQSFSPSAEAANSGDMEDEDFATPRSRKRPKFLDRMASQRSSYSSYTTISTNEGSEVTVGADYALQSGGAAPFNESTHSRPNMDLSRTTSLGSMASGVSTLSEGEDKIWSASSALDAHLGTLNEEASAPEHDDSQGDEELAPQTPRGADRGLNTPTETVISQHVRDVLVPATVVREYRDRHRPPSPEKRNGAPTPSIHQHGKSLTLKEQSSTIDRLMKENWDLKLKISFLNDALNRRSDEGVKAIISENVELRTAKFQSMTEIRELKRSVRELDRKLREKSDQLAENFKKFKQAESTHGNEDQQDIDDRVTYLTERLMTYEVEIERMRHEISTREGERRRMAEVLKKAGERRGPDSDIGAREEMDMWKDLLDAETARREQADEDNKKLREEIWRLKSDSSSTTTNNYAANVHHINNKHHTSSSFSHTNSSSGDGGRNRSTSAASSTLVEQLRHENAELRREVGAQTSMLTSRNREKERLYQEIEELKLGARRGDGTRSVAGDSIFERSVSRAQDHSASRITEIDRINQISDAERDVLETRNEQLRDQINELKLDNISCRRQIDVLLEEFTNLKAEHETLEQLYDDDMSCATEEIRMLERDRDEANKYSEELETEIQEIKSEAQDRINAFVGEVDQKNQDLERLETDVANQAEQSNALNKEVRSLNERIQRVGEDIRSKVKKIQDLEIEIEAINRENEILDKDYHEEKDKNARLTVQQESSQNEIAFLREEQDGDKIRIGDLEDHVNNLKSGLSSEKDRVKDLESRLAEERHQHEVIGSKEKEEVQKIINGLNREASDAQEEARKLKQSLQSTEIEATTFKERLMELESNLREALGDSNGTRSTFLTSIAKLQKDLAATASELDVTKNSLSERERLLKNRDALLESHGLESKKLSELLDRERQARRADKAQHEQWQRTHQHTSRTVSQKDTRITELETSRQAERRKVAQLEQQFKDQLAERNNLLLTLWNRISAMCGADWQHQNTLVNNHLPTVEVVASMLPSFSKTLLHAVKTVEGMLQGFKGRVRTIERDLWKEYQTLETNLESRIKKLDRLEATVQSQRVAGTFTAAPEIAKLRGENRLLKSEIAVLQNKEMHARASSRLESNSVIGGSRGTATLSTAQPPPTLMRHHSSSAVEALERASLGVSPHNSSATAALIGHSSTPMEPSQQRWIHRLRELERRLKAEREARLLDRSGARKRLEEGMAENERLKQELEKERVRKAGTVSS